MSFPIDPVRARFPALAIEDGGRPRAYFDAPGGTQVCADAIDAMAAHLAGGTANAGGAFVTSIATDATARAAHQGLADLIGAHPDEIALGPNMTSLTLALSRALAREWRAGDELVVTRLDHDANVAPWLQVAQDRGMTVRWIDFDPANGRWRLDALADLLSERTRLVALGAASNALGTLNPVADAIAIVRAHSDAFVFVDAVQSVPHVATDVAALDCDFLACSPYKFFGPHLGALWTRPGAVADVEAYKVRPASNGLAHRFESGTPSFEAQAGLLGTLAYLEWLGEQADPHANSRPARLHAAMRAIETYEHDLSAHLLDRLTAIPALTLYGPPTTADRVPTFAFTLDGHAPGVVAEHLARHNIFAWSGHFYAVEAIDRLGLAEQGGLVRVGLCHYNTKGEVDRLADALEALV